jgi:hypothetical protein
MTVLSSFGELGGSTSIVMCRTARSFAERKPLAKVIQRSIRDDLLSWRANHRNKPSFEAEWF